MEPWTLATQLNNTGPPASIRYASSVLYWLPMGFQPEFAPHPSAGSYLPAYPWSGIRLGRRPAISALIGDFEG
ncbi:MAG: hypothetical protein ACRDRS_01475 [Pseudonocardiaceae bacterium]